MHIMHLVESVLLGTAGLFGVFGNILILICVLLYSALRRSSNVFVVCLAITDLIVCIYVIPVAIVTSYTNVATSQPIFCEISAFIFTTSSGVSTQFLALIAIQRYIYVCKPLTRSRHLFRPKWISLIVSAVWILVASLAAQGWSGWTSYMFDRDLEVCTLKTNASKSFNIIAAVLAVIGPLIIMTFSYGSVIHTALRSRCRLQAGASLHRTSTFRNSVQSQGTGHSSIAVSEPRSDSLLHNSIPRDNCYKSEVKVVCTVVMLVIVFTVCWLPAAIVMVFGDMFLNLKKIAIWGVLLNSCCNFILYGILNGNFRHCYKQLYHSVIRCKFIRYGEYRMNGSQRPDISTLAGTSPVRTILQSSQPSHNPTVATPAVRTSETSTLCSEDNSQTIALAPVVE